jgi:ribosomal protein S18 acetylase RimI-like enzyme
MTNTETMRIAGHTPASSENYRSSLHTQSTTLSTAARITPEPGADERKLALLKRTGLFGSDLKGAQILRATSLEDLQAAYSLVHQVYLRSGYIHSEPSGMRLRIYETSSETATFIAKCDGRVVGVISVVGDSVDLGLPSDSAFQPELDHLRAQGMKLCEVTNQVVADDFRKSGVTTELMRCAVAHSIKTGYRAGVATVSPSHNGFYDLLGFQQVGSERSYSQKLHDPVVALVIDWDNYRNPPEGLTPASLYVHNFLGPENPYLNRVQMWDRKARAQFLNAELLEELFVVRSDFLSKCSPAELEIVRMRWGQELFRAVASSLPTYKEESTASAVPFPDFQPPVAALRVRTPALATGGGGTRERVSHNGRGQLPFAPMLDLPHGDSRNHRAASLWFWIGTILDGRERQRLALGN